MKVKETKHTIEVSKHQHQWHHHQSYDRRFRNEFEQDTVQAFIKSMNVEDSEESFGKDCGPASADCE